MTFYDYYQHTGVTDAMVDPTSAEQIVGNGCLSSEMASQVQAGNPTSTESKTIGSTHYNINVYEESETLEDGSTSTQTLRQYITDGGILKQEDFLDTDSGTIERTLYNTDGSSVTKSQALADYNPNSIGFDVGVWTDVGSGGVGEGSATAGNNTITLKFKENELKKNGTTDFSETEVKITEKASDCIYSGTINGSLAKNEDKLNQ